VSPVKYQVTDEDVYQSYHTPQGAVTDGYRAKQKNLREKPSSVSFSPPEISY
jgi:hypothetical protein